MGLFGKRDKAPAEPLTEAEGYCGIAVAAIYSDGVITGEEDERLLDALLDLDALEGAEERALRASLERMVSFAKRHGEGRLLKEAAAAIPPARRVDAFRLAADIIVADGVLESDEREFLERFRVALDLDVMQAKRVLETIG